MSKDLRRTGIVLVVMIIAIMYALPAGAEEAQQTQDVQQTQAAQPVQEAPKAQDAQQTQAAEPVQEAPKAQEPAKDQARTNAMLDTKGKVRLSLNPGIGVGFAKVDVGVTSGGDTVSLSGGGGLSLGVGIGYGLSRDFDLDVDLGGEAGALTPAVSNAEGSFTRGFLLATLKYKIPTSDSGQFKIGAGIGEYFGGELEFKRTDVPFPFEEVVKYKTATGVHFTGEFERFVRENFSFSLGAKIYFVKYKADSYTLNNVDVPVGALKDEVRDLNGNGMDLMIGVNLYFN